MTPGHWFFYRLPGQVARAEKLPSILAVFGPIFADAGSSAMKILRPNALPSRGGHHARLQSTRLLPLAGGMRGTVSPAHHAHGQHIS